MTHRSWVWVILMSFLFVLAFVGRPNSALSVAAQQIATPTPTTNGDIIALRAQLEELRRSQEQALDNITAVTTMGAGIGAGLIAVAVVLIGFNIRQGNRNYERDKSDLEKYVRDQTKETLDSTSKRLADDYSIRLNEAVELLRDPLQQTINERFHTRQQQNAETMNRWYHENQALVAGVADAAWRAQANDARILMRQAGLPTPDLKEHELRPRINDALAAIMDLIDVAAQPENSTRLSMSFYFLESYLKDDSVSINQSERYQIEARLKRHRGHLHLRADELEQLVGERYVQAEMY